MKVRSILVFCVVIFGFFLLSTAYAENNKEGGRKRERIQKIFEQLNLTDEQKKQLAENRQQHKEKAKALFEQKKSYREALKQELMQTEIDSSKISEIQSQIKTLQSQMSDDRLSSILEVRKILTPEQFKEFISIMEKQKPSFFSRKDKKS